MTSHAEAGPPAAVATRPESKIVSFARLGKFDVYDYYPAVAVALSAVLLPLDALRPAVLGTLALFLAGAVCTVAGLVALDDVTGYRDGSDIANYGPDAPLRRKLRKPLVAGTLTVPEALAFGWTATALGGVLWTAAVLAAPSAPVWTVVLIAVLFVISPQYSYGLRISYHGFQECYIAGLGVALVLGAYGLAAGRFSAFLLVQALLFGLGPLLFGVYSNTNDVPGDRAVGRPTVAVLTTPRGNAVFIAALSAGEFLLGAAASATGIAPWWFVLLMLPVTGLRLRQYLTGFRHGDIMRARRMGFPAHRVGTLLLIVANLLAGAGFGGAGAAG